MVFLGGVPFVLGELPFRVAGMLLVVAHEAVATCLRAAVSFQPINKAHQPDIEECHMGKSQIRDWTGSSENWTAWD